MNHATILSASVQEKDLASLTDPDPHLVRGSIHVPLCEEELESVMEFRPLLDGDGFHFRGTGSSEDEADDRQSLLGDPEARAKTSQKLRITLRQKDEDHFRAWLAQESALTDLRLEDEQPISDGKDTPHVGVNPTFPKQAKKDRGFDPQTTCLMTILLSDGCRWTMHLDDVMQVCHDVTTELADLHAASIVYGDMRVENIYVNNQGRGFLISTTKSKEQKNNDLLLEECARDVKALCKIIGGMYQFYFRNKLPASWNSNQEAETAFCNLLKRGYRDCITAKDFLEELGPILVSDEVHVHVDEPVEVSRPESGLKKKKSSLGIDDYTPEPKSETADNQGPEPESGPIDNQILSPYSGAVDVQGAESVPELGPVNANAPKPESEAFSTPLPVQGSLAVSLVIPGLGPGAISNQGPEIGSGAFANQGPGNEPRDGARERLELLSGEAEDHNLDREYSSDRASTHDQLMSDFDMEMYFSA